MNEEGVEAAAVSMVTMTSACQGAPDEVEFFVDHPFVFFILTGTEHPAFMGHVVRPEQ